MQARYAFYELVPFRLFDPFFAFESNPSPLFQIKHKHVFADVAEVDIAIICRHGVVLALYILRRFFV